MLPVLLARLMTLGKNLKSSSGHLRTFPWYLAIFLALIDYKSSFAYVYGLSLKALGPLAPIGIILLCGTTALIWLVYKEIVKESPFGQGSVALYEKYLGGWKTQGILVVVLGVSITCFLWTGGLSSSDATEHWFKLIGLPDNTPIWPTACVIAVLGVLLCVAGAEKAIGVCTFIAGIYILFSLSAGLTTTWVLVQNPQYITLWWAQVDNVYHGDMLHLLGDLFTNFSGQMSGVSGYETTAVIILVVKGYSSDTKHNPIGRKINGVRLVSTAAFSMIFLLISGISFQIVAYATGVKIDSIIGTVPAFFAHLYWPVWLAKVYDTFIVLILMFAEVSSIAGFVTSIKANVPRNGMGPQLLKQDWFLYLQYAIAVVVIIFVYKGDVTAQSAPYVNGVLGLITFGAGAIFIAQLRKGNLKSKLLYGAIFALLVYIFAMNARLYPFGTVVMVGVIFIVFLLAAGFRIFRSTELRGYDANHITFSQKADTALKQHMHAETVTLHMVDPSNDDNGLLREGKLGLSVHVSDPSRFETDEDAQIEIGIRDEVLWFTGNSVPNAIAGVARTIRELYNCNVLLVFNLPRKHPVLELLEFLLLGRGNVPALVIHILQRAATLELHEEQSKYCIEVVVAGKICSKGTTIVD